MSEISDIIANFQAFLSNSLLLLLIITLLFIISFVSLCFCRSRFRSLAKSFL